MKGQMMTMPLLISAILQHADRWHGDTEVVSRTVEGPIHRYTFHDLHQRARQLANALQEFRLPAGARIATLAWNTYRHLEIYYAVSGSGYVCHTINPRLFPEQIAWIINDAADDYVFFDLSFVALVENLAPLCPNVKGWVLMSDRSHQPTSNVPMLCYETLIEAASDEFDWPSFDENTASSLCYTSGTTGNPKGALYSHRSTVLHAMTLGLPDNFGLSARETLLPVVPMFHVNAWGIPYAALMVGCRLVLPGPKLDGASLHELYETETVTLSAGVPTVWLGLLQYLDSQQVKLNSVRRLIVGGAAVPAALMDAYQDRYGVEVQHLWGMTELSPLGTSSTLKVKHLNAPAAVQHALRCKQGRPPFGIDLRITDDHDHLLPHDGNTFGYLQARGHWVIDSYYGSSREPLLHDGWFSTGDVATIDEDGFMHITDRAKDVIKSGGEWISSVTLENHAMTLPEVAEAAVIGIPHPKWDERPLLILVLKKGKTLSPDTVQEHLRGKVAKWWLPEEVVFVDELPHTATGKISKLNLRNQFAQYRRKSES